MAEIYKFKTMPRSSYIILRIQRLDDKQCRSDEAAHYELPHLDLRCLQIQLHVLSFLAFLG